MLQFFALCFTHYWTPTFWKWQIWAI